MTQVRLRVREEVGVARDAEVVVCGVPLPAGLVTDVTSCCLCGPGGEPVPVQPLRVERYPDGSARWLALAFPVRVGPMEAVEYTLSVAGTTAAPERSVQVARDGDRIVLDTGAVRVRIASDPFDPLGSLPGLRSTRVLLVGPDGVGYPAVCESADATVVHDGPLLARVRTTGRYRAETGASWAFESDVTAVAGADHVDVDVRVVNDADEAESAVAEWRVELTTAQVGSAVCGVFDAAHRSAPPFAVRHRGEGHPRGIFATAEVVGGDDWVDVSPAEYYEQWEWAELHGRQATNWVTAHTEDADLTVAVHRFGENHPGEITVNPHGVLIRFWPAEAGELRLTQGAAKTRRLRVTVGEDRRSGLRLDHPLVAEPIDALRPDVAGVDGALLRILPYLPSRYPNLEAHIREELFGWYQSGQSLGFHDLGDSVQGITTGPRTGYSANNEHDALYALTLHYLRSGERAYFDSAQSYADHLRDVDLIHHSTRNPYEVGGLRAHGRAHVHYVRARTPHGEIWSSVDTGHMWTEGLVLFAQVSGDDRYLEAARRVGDCLIRLAGIGWTRPEPGPRNSGWPIIALTALARATGEARYLDTALSTARAAIARQRPDGRWMMRLGLADDYCAWQNAVLLTGLARLLELDDDVDVRKAFLAGSRAMLDLGRNPDNTFIYMERFDYRWANRAAQIREALAFAYDATGDERFLLAGLDGGDRWYRPRGAKPALSNDIAEWRGHLPFLARAHDADLLTDLSGD